MRGILGGLTVVVVLTISQFTLAARDGVVVGMRLETAGLGPDDGRRRGDQPDNALQHL